MYRSVVHTPEHMDIIIQTIFGGEGIKHTHFKCEQTNAHIDNSDTYWYLANTLTVYSFGLSMRLVRPIFFNTASCAFDPEFPCKSW